MGEPVWKRQLMTPERALELGGRWSLTVVRRTESGTQLRTLALCTECRRQVTELGWRTDVQTILEAVLRHAVVHHELSLSAYQPEETHVGARRGEGPGDPAGDPPGGEPDADPGGRLDEAPAGGGAPSWA